MRAAVFIALLIACDDSARHQAPPDVRAPAWRHSVADVAARVTPSVVNVFSERTLRSPHSPLFDDGATLRQRGLGSGVIISADGVILTNSHLVAEADAIKVALQDGRQLDAKLVGADPQTDIAVLRVRSARPLPAIAIADSSKLRTGDLVLAIGNPFGIGQTVTFGIISAVGRANMGITDYEDFIQTDAAINPGNSGGALVDMQGRLVGINTAIASRSGSYEGIGFAIPINMAMQVRAAIAAHGRVVRGYLGVAVRDLTEDLRRGVVVSDVVEGSPAARAGIAIGDVIVAFEGKPVTTAVQLRNAIALAGKGKRIELALVHGRSSRTIAVTLVEAHERSERPASS
jgi:Do/DeqQ family serine protease